MTIDQHYAEAVAALSARLAGKVEDPDDFARTFIRELLAHGWRHAYAIEPPPRDRPRASDEVRTASLAECRQALRNTYTSALGD